LVELTLYHKVKQKTIMLLYRVFPHLAYERQRRQLQEFFREKKE